MHTYQPFELFDESINESIKMMLEFIKNIICGEKQDSYYEFTLKWLANMIRGNKNNSCLYLKDEAQGIGKSTSPLFIKKHVIGKDLCLETGSNFINSILEDLCLETGSNFINNNSILEGLFWVYIFCRISIFWWTLSFCIFQPRV